MAGSLFSSAFAEGISIDKSDYTFGDTIIISGTVSYESGNFIGLQIVSPLQSDIVVIDQFFPQNDGTFSKSYKAQGTKWNADGIYTIKLVYNEQVYEKTFQFKKEVTSTTVPTTEPKSSTESTPSTKSTSITKTPKSSYEILSSDPKLWIKGFPDPQKTPNYYFDRFENDAEYKAWFKKTFPGRSIYEIVSYPSSHIDGFPDNSKSPAYYVQRYFSEQEYTDWFDSQFPSQSIYEVLGYPESFFQKVPNWVKNNAKWWSSGLISDSDFLQGITYLIDEKILLVPNLPESEATKTQKIPVWIKNTSQWWADGKINENEFLKGIEFLVANGIIRV